jgi:SAM-dependent methyltransferase
MNNAHALNSEVRLGASCAWNELVVDRGGFQREFVRLVSECPQLDKRVLDIGCGANLPLPLAALGKRIGTLDGVDPDPDVARHPLLQQRWQGCFESSPIPEEAYDLAFAYNVLEHIRQPRPFFEKVKTVLKPGGVFWGLTPNQRHPFALLSRSIELIGLKGFARRQMGQSQNGAMRVNDYPAYYRCNSPSAVRGAIRGIGFSRATFYFHPCLQWDTYFPPSLRGLPHAYDFVLGTRLAPLMQIFIVRLDN